MTEYLDIRCQNIWAIAQFGESVGEPLYAIGKSAWDALDAKGKELLRPITRKIIINTSDPFMPELRAKIMSAQRAGAHVTYTVFSTRTYTPAELEGAELVQLKINAVFEPSGIDAGTEYDESISCPKCGFGRVQVSPLRLNLSRLPKNKDIARTIACDEWIISRRLLELLRDLSVSGVEFERVENVGSRRPMDDWYQLKIWGSAGRTSAPTRFGIDYFRDAPDERFMCLEHQLVGLNLLSEVTLAHRPTDLHDFMITSDRYGRFGGSIVPVPALIVTQRVSRLFRELSIKGALQEVVNISC
jgi:hypothetical protein